MIVRISGEGQYELDNTAVRQLDQLDTQLTAALDAQDEKRFQEVLAQTIELIRTQGKAVPHDRVVGSNVIVPPDDVSLQEAQSFFTDEGLMEPLPA
jgi:hypothetical protein